ncbi:GNAT family N-acetyltransferase [Martelella soudanensis]|uniref:GNAT family N-acetyltransferase n=1 Tax=unclassified Martelella TaxID=2629616 RepID=UPI0015DEF9E3|nr:MULTISPECIES: N-acetyltransferase [unclassified Martelella]
MIIRRERLDDVAAISELVAEAFAAMPYSDGHEADIIRRLRKAGALSLALVAEEEGRPVGHIAFSPVGISDGNDGWFGLGPLAVDPAFQRREIGAALVLGGLELLKDDGARGVVVLGAPGFYQRFGFRHEPALTLDGAPPGHFMALDFDGVMPRGKVAFHKAFYGKA